MKRHIEINPASECNNQLYDGEAGSLRLEA